MKISDWCEHEERSDDAPPLVRDTNNLDDAWAAGLVIAGSDPAIWRRDVYGSVIRYDAYADPHSPFGWSVIRIALYAANAASRPQPLHLENVRRLRRAAPAEARGRIRPKLRSRWLGASRRLRRRPA